MARLARSSRGWRQRRPWCWSATARVIRDFVRARTSSEPTGRTHAGAFGSCAGLSCSASRSCAGFPALLAPSSVLAFGAVGATQLGGVPKFRASYSLYMWDWAIWLSGESRIVTCHTSRTNVVGPSQCTTTAAAIWASMIRPVSHARGGSATIPTTPSTVVTRRLCSSRTSDAAGSLGVAVPALERRPDPTDWGHVQRATSTGARCAFIQSAY